MQAKVSLHDSSCLRVFSGTFMPSSRFAHRQRTLGGLAGVVVLVLALVYHFSPMR